MSEIRVTTISNAAGTGPVTLTKQHAAKAWINLNGSGTIAIRDSFNISSAADDGTGQYTANLSTNMSDANYAMSIGGQDGAGGAFIVGKSSGTYTASANQVCCRSGSSFFDTPFISVTFNGDLA